MVLPEHQQPVKPYSGYVHSSQRSIAEQLTPRCVVDGEDTTGRVAVYQLLNGGLPVGSIAFLPGVAKHITITFAPWLATHLIHAGNDQVLELDPHSTSGIVTRADRVFSFNWYVGVPSESVLVAAFMPFVDWPTRDNRVPVDLPMAGALCAIQQRFAAWWWANNAPATGVSIIGRSDEKEKQS